jgi:hypothetical protein
MRAARRTASSSYFIVLYALFSAWLFTRIHQTPRTFLDRGRDWFSAATVAAAAVYLVFFIPGTSC